MKDYKPSESIFRKLIDDSGIKPDETIFLDDGERNVSVAESIGLHGLHVRENKDWMPLLLNRLKSLG